jgi:hypothetical protein
MTFSTQTTPQGRIYAASSQGSPVPPPYDPNDRTGVAFFGGTNNSTTYDICYADLWVFNPQVSARFFFLVPLSLRLYSFSSFSSIPLACCYCYCCSSSLFQLLFLFLFPLTILLSPSSSSSVSISCVLLRTAHAHYHTILSSSGLANRRQSCLDRGPPANRREGSCSQSPGSDSHQQRWSALLIRRLQRI